MATHHFGQAPLQSLAVQRSLPPGDAGPVVKGSSLRLQLVEKPPARLSERKRRWTAFGPPTNSHLPLHQIREEPDRPGWRIQVAAPPPSLRSWPPTRRRWEIQRVRSGADPPRGAGEPVPPPALREA